MKRIRRYLMEPGNDTLLRSASGAVLGACMALVPPLSGRMDSGTFLIVFLIGMIVILPVWRYAGEALNTPITIITFLVFLVGPLIVARVFSGMAVLTFIGGWGCTLGVMRIVTGWRDPENPAPDPELDPDGTSRLLAWVVLLPFLILVGVILLAIAMERGAIR